MTFKEVLHAFVLVTSLFTLFISNMEPESELTLTAQAIKLVDEPKLEGFQICSMKFSKDKAFLNAQIK